MDVDKYKSVKKHVAQAAVLVARSGATESIATGQWMNVLRVGLSSYIQSDSDLIRTTYTI